MNSSKITQKSNAKFFFQCSKCSWKFISSRNLRNHVCRKLLLLNTDNTDIITSKHHYNSYNFKHSDKSDLLQTKLIKLKYELKETYVNKHHSETQTNYNLGKSYVSPYNTIEKPKQITFQCFLCDGTSSFKGKFGNPHQDPQRRNTAALSDPRTVYRYFHTKHCFWITCCQSMGWRGRLLWGRE